MLTSFKQLTRSWAAKILILLIVVSFGVWGISGAVIGGYPDSVITVGKTDVSAREYLQSYEQVRGNASRQLGRPLTNEDMLVLGMEENMVNLLVNTAVLNEGARTMGLGISDKSLAELLGRNESFQDASGNFDQNVLEQVLRQMGMSESGYIKILEEEALRNQLIRSVSGNATLPMTYLDAYREYLNEKRVFEYVTLSPEMLEKTFSPTSQDIKTYYEQHKFRYVKPEYRKITIVKLEPEDIADPDSITPEEVFDEYEARKAEFSTDEKRSIQQLILQSEEQGKKILSRLENGETLDAILAEMGKTANDISIGEYTHKDIPDVNMAKAVFSMKPDEVSDVIPGIFGPVLLRVTKIIPASARPLSEVEEDIRKYMALDKADEELFEIHDHLEDARSGGADLSEAAARVQLPVRILEKVNISGHSPEGSSIASFPESAKLLSEAFKAPEGMEMDPVSIGNTGFIWYEVNEIFPKRQKELDEVRDQVAKNWNTEKIAAEMKKVAKDLQSRIMAGKKFSEALTSVFPKKKLDKTQMPEIEKTSELSRQQADVNLPANAVQAGFDVAVNEAVLAAGKNGTSQIVLKVVRVVQKKDNVIETADRKQLDNIASNDLLSQFIDDLKRKKSVVINQAAIASAKSLDQNYRWGLAQPY